MTGLPWDGKLPLVSGIILDSSVKILGDVQIGQDSSVWFNTVVRGDGTRGVIIGVNTHILENCFVEESRIGDNVLVSHGAILHGCDVEDNVLVGIGARLLNGALIGRGAVIGAGAVIKEDQIVEPDSVVVGVPGKVIKTLEPEDGPRHFQELANVLERARYYSSTAIG